MLRHASNNVRPGITLIEVLAALAVFLIALAGIFQLVEFGTDGAVEASRKNIGTRLAQSKMAEVEAGLIDVIDGGSGTFDVEEGWQWEVTSTPSDAPNVYIVNVICKSTVGREVKVELWQMILDPESMGTAGAQASPTAGASQ